MSDKSLIQWTDFVKQLGAQVIDHDATAAHTCPERECWPPKTMTVGHKIRLNDHHGGDMSEWPEDLRVREWPVEHSSAKS